MLYQIHDVLPGYKYRLSRDGHLERVVFQKADLLLASESSTKYEPRVDESSGDMNAKEYLRNTFERTTAFTGSWTKPIKEKAIGSDPIIAYENTELDGSKAPSDKTKIEDVGEAKAGNIPLAPEKAEGSSVSDVSLPRLNFGQIRKFFSAEDDRLATRKTDWPRASPPILDYDQIYKDLSAEDDQIATRKAKGLGDTSVSHPRLDYDHVWGSLSAEDDQLATRKVSQLDDTRASFSNLDDDDVLEEVSVTDDQSDTEKIKEFEITRASFSELDDDGMLEDVSARDDQLVRRQSREEAKTQKLGSVLSRFGLGERPLIDGKKRVRWRCGCGRNLYDDFTELRSGAAAKLEKWLNDSMRKRTGSSASNSQRSATLTSAVSPNAGSSGYEQTTESDISLQSLDPSANVLPASNMNADVAIDVHLEKCWLILCGNMKRGPDVLLEQMNLSSAPSDKSLFEDMKRVYSNFKQSLTRRSFLRGVKTIRFVQVGPFI